MNHCTVWPGGDGILLRQRSPEVSSINNGVPLGFSGSSFCKFGKAGIRKSTPKFDLEKGLQITVSAPETADVAV
jgi:hypothetical protein